LNTIYRYLLIILLILFLAGCSSEANKVTVSAVINDAEGNPLPLYGLQVIDVNKAWLSEPELSVTGEYDRAAQINLINDKPVILKFSAPGHRPAFTFLMPDFDTIHFKASLKTGEEPEEMNPVVIGNLNSFDARSGIEMDLDEDGIWRTRLETELDTIQYVIYLNTMIAPPGNTGNIIINTESRGFETTFLAEVIRTEGESGVTVEFNPNTLPEGETESKIEIVSQTTENIKGVSEISALMFDEYMNQVFSSVMHHRSGKPGMYEHNMEPFLEELEELTVQYDNSDVAFAATLAKLRFPNEIEISKTEVSKLLSEISAESPLWILHPTVLTTALEKTGVEEYESLVQDIAERSPFHQIRGEALFNLIRYYYNNNMEREWHAAFSKLTSNYPNHFRTTRAYGEYAPQVPIAEGMPLKHDEFNALDGSDKIRLNELEESFLLIDFWASWCGPCIAAMPKLHDLNDKMGEDDFAIVSISIDEKREHVLSVQEEWEMPWYNAYENPHTGDKIRELGIFSVPRYLLLGPDRKVLTQNQNELRRGDLAEVIRGYMESEKESSD